jgi:Transposase, Mutator family
VHWYRNIFNHVPSTKVREIAAMLKAIHASEDLAAAREKAIRVIDKLRGLRLSRAAELVETAVEETLTYYAFPEEHWRRIRTNNPLERILREIRRRTRVVGAFPDGQSALNLAAARLRHMHGVVDQKISEHRVAEGPADERCHHRVSQGRVPLSQPKVRKILDTTGPFGSFANELVALARDSGRQTLMPLNGGEDNTSKKPEEGDWAEHRREQARAFGIFYQKITRQPV